MADYSFIVPSYFKPLSFQERLAPFLIAKQEYDKQEQEYLDRQDKIDRYSYLNDYDDDSPAKKLYQGYVNEYNRSFDDFQQNGMSQANKRSWLDVRRTYQKNIGRLDEADKELQKIRDLRLEQKAKDPTMMYADEMPDIDDMLDGRKKFNDYAISGDYLYKRGAEIGASASSRIYSNPEIRQLTDAFLNFTQTQGITQQDLDAFRADLSSRPAFQKAIMDELKADGVTDNLTGANLQRATQSIVNGFVNGAVFKRTDSPQANPDYIAAYQNRQLDIAEKELKLKEDAANAAKKDDTTDIHPTQLSSAVKITWNHNNPAYSGVGEKNHSQYYDADGKQKDDSVTSEILKSDAPIKGTALSFAQLPAFAIPQVMIAIKNGNPNYYDYFYTPYKTANPLAPGHPWINDNEATLTIVPRDLTTDKIPVENLNKYKKVGK